VLDQPRRSRWPSSTWAVLLMASIAVPTIGCGALAGGRSEPARATSDLLPAFGQARKERDLRKQVEADPFPTAQQAGIP
jgi:hypothetical protein